MTKERKQQLLNLLVERGIADCIRSASEMVRNNEVMVDGVPVKELTTSASPLVAATAKIEYRRKATLAKPTLAALIVKTGIARSIHEARQMLLAGEICHEKKGKQYEESGNAEGWYHGKPMNVRPDMWSIVGDILLTDDTKVVHRSHCPECRKRPLVFAGKGKAKSTAPAPISGSACVSQVDLAELVIRRRELMDAEERIAVLLSKGAHVETDGAYTAELVPTRDEFGNVCLKLVIR